MTTVWEAQTLDNVQTEEAKRHNEMIRERYRQLQNAEEIQLSETFSDAEQAKEIAPSAPAFNAAPAAPVAPVAPAPAEPARTEERRANVSQQQRELFTADTFRRVLSDNVQEQTVAPVQAEAVREIYAPAPVFVPEKKNEVVKEAQKEAETYSLTSAAKAMIAAFAALVVLMLTVIGINTRILNAKGAELTALELQRAELVEESRALAENIVNATSEETIANWAAQYGWTK